MFQEDAVRELVDDVFEEEALAIGGLVALYHVDETAVQRLFASLTVIRDKTLRRIGSGGAPAAIFEERPRSEPHPAVEEFLARLGRS
ncbi:MAG: hypothetical protein U0167_15260 [bacterium]